MCELSSGRARDCIEVCPTVRCKFCRGVVTHIILWRSIFLPPVRYWDPIYCEPCGIRCCPAVARQSPHTIPVNDSGDDAVVIDKDIRRVKIGGTQRERGSIEGTVRESRKE